MYREGIKCVNLIEIGQVVIEIRGTENGELAVPVNNTLVYYMAFLAADTRPCVLISTCLIGKQLFSHRVLYFKRVTIKGGTFNLVQ